jgi:HPt (histidine-containing phosphotransfer) domain-containing protein
MPNSEVIDRSALRNLLEMFNGDEAFLGQVIDTFLSDATHLLGTIRQSTLSGKADDLRRAAHSLKSNSANLGALSLSALGKELEYIGKGGTVEGAAERLALLDAEYARVRTALQAIRESGLNVH